jgi:hypothetical protein
MMYNIKMDLKELGCEGVSWIYLLQDRDLWQAVVNTVMNLCVPQKGGEIFDYLSGYFCLMKDSAL